jgi:TIR domain
MPLVFVSYSSQDRDIAAKLVDRLRKAAPEELEIVIDEAIDAETDAMPSGAYRLPYVGKRLRNANAVISVLTRSYAESDPCWLEMSAALMMDKVVPINLDPGLSPAGVASMVTRKNIIAIAPGWFNKEPGEVEAAETAKFERFVRELADEARKHHPFSAWQPADPKDVRPMTIALAAALHPRAFRKTGLVWSPGSIAEVQKRRFFAAIESMSIATGDSVWDVARRKALKAMSEAPTASRVRAEALMGLVGELTAPSDGSAPIIAQEPWEFLGDFALPIDRDISRFAYTKAGKIPNELRKIFQVLRPGRSKRRAIFAAGTLLGGLAGVALTYGGQMLFGQLNARDTTPPVPPSDTPTPPSMVPTPAPSVAPPLTPPAPAAAGDEPSQPVTTANAPEVTSATAPPPLTFSVSARGLEASVRAGMAERGLDAGAWKEIYGQVISLNINTLCSPEKWQAAETMGKKPLDVISAETQLTWPTETDFAKPVRLQECPIYRIPT